MTTPNERKIITRLSINGPSAHLGPFFRNSASRTNTSITIATCYYFYDAISPLKGTLTQELGWDSGDYGQFRSAYSWPNVFLFMAVIGGIIADKLGIRITGNFFVSCMVAGTFVTWYGATDYFTAGGFGHAFFASFLTGWSPSLKVIRPSAITIVIAAGWR